VDAVAALRDIAFELERAGAPTYRVRAFRRAADALLELPAGELSARLAAESLQAVAGIGPVTAAVIAQAAAGQQPDYLTALRADNPPSARTGLRGALRGDCHAHSDWSDGGSPPREMAEAARDLGHEWLALTDHSPRLTVARGLSAERLEEQLDLISALNADLAPFRVLTGTEVDILDDGTLDQREDLLGHCTGRLLAGRGRPEPDFDAEAVFAACAASGVAVEINCRPERQDPPDQLLRVAVDAGCQFAIDTDAHAPGQLDWLGSGCRRAEEHGIEADRIINTRSADAVTAQG
jgi:putative hydrolase